jgi:hypothetical protein
MVWCNPEKLEEIVSQALFSLRLRLAMGDVNCVKMILADRILCTCERLDVLRLASPAQRLRQPKQRAREMDCSDISYLYDGISLL